MKHEPQIPVHRTIIEAPYSELRALSGVFDEATGRELTNQEVVDDFARKLGAVTTFPATNGRLSEAAKQHNSEVTRSGEGEIIMGVIGVFAPEEDHA